MSAIGLWMLLVLGILILLTGLPFWVLLIGVSSAFAIVGLLTQTIDLNLLTALSGRIVGLLEHDLLQALPLYVFIGVLLKKLAIGDSIFSTFRAGLMRLFGHRPAHEQTSTSLATLGVSALIAPMSGSVASSASLLSRLIGHRLGNMRATQAAALISASATIGVVVPPSLVLILLGDAMLRAHTEASNLPGYQQAGTRIIGTQDVLNAALLPSLLVLILWIVVVCLQSRRSSNLISEQSSKSTSAVELISISKKQIFLTIFSTCFVVSLLWAVFSGLVFAVEAAALGGCTLMIATLLTRALDWSAWKNVLNDTLCLSGALFAMLVAATTFSLVFRAYGTDELLTQWALRSGMSAAMTAICLLGFVAICALVLEAFEMIFVIIPIVAPTLILCLGDAQQAAVLILLVLQTSFLIPPTGYAITIVRQTNLFGTLTNRSLIRAVFPFVAVQVLVIALVFFRPQWLHWLDTARSL